MKELSHHSEKPNAASRRTAFGIAGRILDRVVAPLTALLPPDDTGSIGDLYAKGYHQKAPQPAGRSPLPRRLAAVLNETLEIADDKGSIGDLYAQAYHQRPEGQPGAIRTIFSRETWSDFARLIFDHDLAADPRVESAQALTYTESEPRQNGLDI